MLLEERSPHEAAGLIPALDRRILSLSVEGSPRRQKAANWGIELESAAHAEGKKRLGLANSGKAPISLANGCSVRASAPGRAASHEAVHGARRMVAWDE